MHKNSEFDQIPRMHFVKHHIHNDARTDSWTD